MPSRTASRLISIALLGGPKINEYSTCEFQSRLRGRGSHDCACCARAKQSLAGAFHQPDASSSCSSAGAGAGRLSDCVRRGPRPPRSVYAEARDLVRPLPLFLAAVPGYLALLAAGPPIGGAMGERPDF